LSNSVPPVARLAPLLPQLVLAFQRRAGELPAALRDAGRLGQRHVAVLVMLAISGPLSVSELAQRSGMTVAHASLVVGELAKAELAERDHDPADRRRILVSLSGTAQPAVAEMRQRQAEPVSRFLGQLSAAEAETFIAQLSLLLSFMRDD
jgi:DNA-binding MarR family transcriptional regulator